MTNKTILKMTTMKTKFILGLALVLSGDCFAAIVYPKAPEGAREIISAQVLPKLENSPGFPGGLRVEDLTFAEPCRDYSVGFTNVTAGRLLSAATSADWRYLIIHGTNAVGAADLIVDEKTGKALKYHRVYLASFSNETLEALRMAEQLPQVKKQDYELRRLEITSLHFVAVWLHSDADDIIMPLPNTYGRWNAYQPYSEKEMIQLLQPAAERLKRFPPGLGG
jgi:hypothetical protein